MVSRNAILVFWALMMVGATAAAQMLPAVVLNDVPALSPRGEGVMRFVGFKVYDVRLWTAMKPHSHAEPFALELVYDMSFKGADIAERSIKEMRGQGYMDEEKLTRWGANMARVFPDIRKGDTLIGVSIPGREARFYNREKFIAAIPDADFARAFFDIWLAEKTSAPHVRAKLLGIP